MYYVVLICALLFSLGLGGFGVICILKRLDRKKGAMKVGVQDASIEYNGVGLNCALCLFLGAAFLYLVFDAVVYGGRGIEKEGPTLLESAVATAAGAEEAHQQNTLPPRTEGWVYAPEGSFTGDEIKKANVDALLRDDHFDDFTGTWLGKLFGYNEPNVVGEIQRDQCVEKMDNAIVGFGRSWMKVTIVNCPDASDD